MSIMAMLLLAFDESLSLSFLKLTPMPNPMMRASNAINEMTMMDFLLR